MPNKVLVVTNDPVSDRMSGPAIRAWELSRQLSRVCEVTLTSKFAPGRAGEGFTLKSFENGAARMLEQARAADVLVVQGTTLYDFPQLVNLGKYLVVDLYAPLVFESYPFFLEQGAGANDAYVVHQRLMDIQMQAGDFFLAASDRQRDMWLGRLCGLKRLVPATFALDPSLQKLIGVVPFGLADEPPQGGAPVLRGVKPGIEPGDFVMLWGGGIWEWFDPLTLIRAIAKLGRPDVKLVFMGLAHPNPDIAPMAMTRRALELANELGLTDKQVFFNHGWVPYDERQQYLLEASAGVSVHFDSIETRFSFRTRVLDYLWAGLPILTTTGDAMAELVAREGLGAVLNYEDVDGWARAIARLADSPREQAEARARVQETARRFRWSTVARPLVDYCQAPYHTPRGLLAPERGGPPLAMWTRKGLRLLRDQGATALVAKVKAKFGR